VGHRNISTVDFVLVEFQLLRLIQKPNQNCWLIGGPVFLLGGSISVSITRKLNFEKNKRTESINFG
jgi:hypothetical protein